MKPSHKFQVLTVLKKLNSQRLTFYVGWIALLTLCVITGGCLSPAEKRGYTSLPQNRPAAWEIPHGMMGR